MATPSLQSLERGLAILAALNRIPGAGIDALSNDLELSRGTIYRLLETLRREGYVTRKHRGRYFADERSLVLGDGRSGWITEDNNAIVAHLSSILERPIYLTTPEGSNMILRALYDCGVRVTSHAEPSERRMLDTSWGQVYLAHCDARQQKVLLRLSNDRNQQNACVQKALEATLHRIRSNGFALSTHKTKCNHLAVPVLDSGRVIAAIAIHFMCDEMSVKGACARYLPMLNETARQISPARMDVPGKW